QKLWITSFEVIFSATGWLVGMCASPAVTKSEYWNSHQNWWPITVIVMLGAVGGLAMAASVRTSTKSRATRTNVGTARPKTTTRALLAASLVRLIWIGPRSP